MYTHEGAIRHHRQNTSGLLGLLTEVMLDKVAHIMEQDDRLEETTMAGGRSYTFKWLCTADAVRSGEFVCLPLVSAYDGNTCYFIIYL